MAASIVVAAADHALVELLRVRARGKRRNTREPEGGLGTWRSTLIQRDCKKPGTRDHERHAHGQLAKRARTLFPFPASHLPREVEPPMKPLSRLRPSHSTFARISAALLLAHTSPALTLPVAEDTYSPSAQLLTKSAGLAGTLNVTPDRAAFIRFDVGLLADALPVEEVKRATLTLFVTKVTKPGELSLHPVLGEWSEAVASPVPEPAVSTPPLITISESAVTARQYLVVDVTAGEGVAHLARH